MTPEKQTSSESTIWNRLEHYFQEVDKHQGEGHQAREARKERREQDQIELELKLAKRQLRNQEQGEQAREEIRSLSTDGSFEVLFFRVGSESYAIRVQELQVVHWLTNCCPVPGSPAYIRGVAHLQGEILSLLDLGILLGADRQGLTDFRRALVVGQRPRRFALVASEVEDIVRIDDLVLQDAPRSCGMVHPACTDGVINRDRILLSVPGLVADIAPAEKQG